MKMNQQLHDGLSMSLVLSLVLAISTQSAIAQSTIEVGDSFKIVNGEIVLVDAGVAPQITAKLNASMSDINFQKLNLITSSSDIVSYSIVTSDGQVINEENIFGGYISLDAKNDLNSRLSQTEAFSNVLELSPSQVIDLRKLHAEMLAELKERTKKIENQKELSLLINEMNSEFLIRVKSILLPFQQAALIKFSVDTVGLVPSVSRLSQGKILDSGVDEIKIKQLAEEQLIKIESTISQLKRNLAQEMIGLLSASDRQSIEAAAGRTLEELISNETIDNLQKQLEFVKNGGLPKFTSMREFAEKLSEDGSDKGPKSQN